MIFPDWLAPFILGLMCGLLLALVTYPGLL